MAEQAAAVMDMDSLLAPAAVVAAQVVEQLRVLAAEVVAAFGRGKGLQPGQALGCVVQSVGLARDRLPVAAWEAFADVAVHKGREHRMAHSHRVGNSRGHMSGHRYCRDRGH